MLTQESQTAQAYTLPASHHSPCHRPLTLKKRDPPISNNNPCGDSVTKTCISNLVLPAIVYQRSRTVRPNECPDTYIGLDLKTPRLNAIHHHLWLAGLPNAARPLHRQRLLGRSILVTQDPDEHLVWFEAQIFVKPLPDYLLDYDYWSRHLCSNKELYQSACGLLLSYTWLVSHKIDLQIAQETGLLSRDVEWPAWVEFLNDFLDNINLVTLEDVSKRYEYGELRSSRLNAIYRFMPPTYSLRNLIRGYRAGPTWHNAYFGRHFRWMLAVFAILSVLLSALQVGLATSVLQVDGEFQRASYGFTIAALVTVLASVVAVFLLWMLLFWYHLLTCLWNDRATDLRRRKNVVLA